MILASLHDRNSAETSLQGVNTPEEVALTTPITFREGHELQCGRSRSQCVVSDDGANSPVWKVKRDRQTQDQEHCRRPEDGNPGVAGDLEHRESTFAEKCHVDVADPNRIALTDDRSKDLLRRRVWTDWDELDIHLTSAEVDVVDLGLTIETRARSNHVEPIANLREILDSGWGVGVG